jgi:N-acetylglutamate synthase-like GNAT family acetyltransferase
MIRVIPFSQQYTNSVIEVILSIQRAEFEIPITLEAQPDLQDVSGFYQSGKGNFWVALDDQEVIGTIGLLDIGHYQAALRKMFVKISHRGRDIGVAKQLLDTLLAWCQTQGVREIYLGTTTQFLAAHRFYEKHGFYPIPVEKLPANFPVMAVDTRFYVKGVSSNEIDNNVLESVSACKSQPLEHDSRLRRNS